MPVYKPFGSADRGYFEAIRQRREHPFISMMQFSFAPERKDDPLWTDLLSYIKPVKNTCLYLRPSRHPQLCRVTQMLEYGGRPILAAVITSPGELFDVIIYDYLEYFALPVKRTEALDK